MAANMNGVCKNIIAFVDGSADVVMLNPRIVSHSGAYETQESCLSLLGGPRKTTRYRKIKVQYQNTALQTRLKTYEGWTAQIIQHEIDHCNGVLIKDEEVSCAKNVLKQKVYRKNAPVDEQGRSFGQARILAVVSSSYCRVYSS